MGSVVYQNKHFDIIVGAPQESKDFPTPRPAYLIINRETGVEEYFHTVLYIAKDWADNFAKMMDEPPKVSDEAVESATQPFSFN